MVSILAKIAAIIFHPLLMPSLGFLLLLNSGFYFSFISWEAKRLIMLVVLFSTAILPLLGLSILAITARYSLSFEKGIHRAIPLLIVSISYYFGYLLLAKMNAIPLLKVLMIAGVLVALGLMMLSLWWKVSSHMAVLGGLTGVLLALAFRTGTNPLMPIIATVIATGLTATSLLVLEKNKLWHLEAGYALGFTTLYLIIYYI